MVRLHLSFAAAALMAAGGFAGEPRHALDFTVQDIDGKDVALSDYLGQAVLIVNVASKCGFTPQYAELQSLYDTYREKGFVVLGFPANDFLWQEPGTNQEIKAFCSVSYGVTFPLFNKIHVRGGDISPLYKYLTDKGSNPEFSGAVSWNFNKFLVNRKGQVVARFGSREKPMSDEVRKAVEAALDPAG